MSTNQSGKEWAIRILLATTMLLSGWLYAESTVVRTVYENTIRAENTRGEVDRLCSLMGSLVEQNRDLLAHLQAKDGNK